MIYVVTSGPASLLAEVLLLAESVTNVLPEQRFVWLVGSSWSPGLASALQVVPGATVEPWQPKIPVSDGEALSRETEIPQALLAVANRPDCTWALYCAPGILWLSRPTEMLAAALESDVVLVPTLLRPQPAGEVPARELEALRHGIFTHRLIAASSSAEGRAFLGWWQKRLLDIPMQDRSPKSWLHLAPALFPSVRILRSLRFNIHRGNLHERRLEGSFPRLTVDGMPVAVLDLGASEEAPSADDVLDPLTLHAFRSVVYWHEHRISSFARSSMQTAVPSLA